LHLRIPADIFQKTPAGQASFSPDIDNRIIWRNEVGTLSHWVRYVPFVILFLVLCANGIAQEADSAQSRNGDSGRLFVTASWENREIGDGFDGETSYSLYYGDIVIPSMDRGNGWRAGFGVRWPRVSLEFGYQKITHTATWRDSTQNAVWEAFYVGTEIMPWGNRQDWIVQPLVTAGADLAIELDLDDGLMDDSDETHHKATYQGYGAHLGGGLLVPVIDRVWITGKVVWRYQNITVVKTPLTSRLLLPDALQPSSVDYSVAVSAALTK
jgi:hypothetical protein